MKCPYCSYEESKVIDPRPTDEGERIRRRRECLKCGKRFTTYEVIETVPVIVIKKDNPVSRLTETNCWADCRAPVKNHPVILRNVGGYRG